MPCCVVAEAGLCCSVGQLTRVVGLCVAALVGHQPSMSLPGWADSYQLTSRLEGGHSKHVVDSFQFIKGSVVIMVTVF